MPYKDPVIRRLKGNEYSRHSRLKHRDAILKRGREWMRAYRLERPNAWHEWHISNIEKHRAERRHQRVEKAKLIDDLKRSGCVDCGNVDIRVLDFDHVRGTKLTGVSMLVGYRIERILAEIAKCEVRCANCHRIKTWERKHGQ